MAASPLVRSDALARCIANCLWQAKPSDPASFVSFLVPLEGVLSVGVSPLFAHHGSRTLRQTEHRSHSSLSIIALLFMALETWPRSQAWSSRISILSSVCDRSRLFLTLDSPGVVLILFSLVLTRGPSLVRQEYCAPTGLLSLIGEDGLCEQVLSSHSRLASYLSGCCQLYHHWPAMQ
jgi:hypothetical protein